MKEQAKKMAKSNIYKRWDSRWLQGIRMSTKIQSRLQCYVIQYENITLDSFQRHNSQEKSNFIVRTTYVNEFLIMPIVFVQFLMVTNLLLERVTLLNLCKSLSLASSTAPGSVSFPLDLSLLRRLPWLPERLALPGTDCCPPCSGRLDSRS